MILNKINGCFLPKPFLTKLKLFDAKRKDKTKFYIKVGMLITPKYTLQTASIITKAKCAQKENLCEYFIYAWNGAK